MVGGRHSLGFGTWNRKFCYYVGALSANQIHYVQDAKYGIRNLKKVVFSTFFFCRKCYTLELGIQ